MKSIRLAVPALVTLSLVAVFACGAQGRSDFDPAAADAGGDSATDGGPGVDTGSFANTDAPPPAEPPSEVWGHSPDTLYKLDPDTKAVTVIGKFKGCTSIIDIALDANSNLFGDTETTLYAIDKTTAACTQIATGSYPNSLSFVPKGTVDPNTEALVGYVGADYVRIDTASGATTTIGSIGSGLESSGDIVSVKGGATYLTVKGTTTCNTKDCLIEVNPTTGALVKNWGSIAHQDVFGLAFWAGSVYGFDSAGELFEVTFTASSISTSAISIPSKPTGLKFWGAGSTTSAPVTPTTK